MPYAWIVRENQFPKGTPRPNDCWLLRFLSRIVEAFVEQGINIMVWISDVEIDDVLIRGRQGLYSLLPKADKEDLFTAADGRFPVMRHRSNRRATASRFQFPSL